MRSTFLFLMIATIACLAEPVNLVEKGDFEAPAKELAKLFSGRGKLSFIQEEIGDNHCAKVEIAKMTKDDKGIETAAANIIVKIPGAKANRTYVISFDIMGTAPRFMLHVNQKGVGRLDVKMLQPNKSATYYEITPDWKEIKGTFRPKQDGDCSITISLWHSTRYGKMFYSVGDYALVDNIEVIERKK